MSDAEKPKKKFYVYEDPDEAKFEESHRDEVPSEGEVRRFKKKERPDRAAKMAALFQEILKINNKSLAEDSDSINCGESVNCGESGHKDGSENKK